MINDPSFAVPAGGDGDTPSRDSFVRVSRRDARYFELSNGKPYIPIGLNMIAPPGPDLSGMEAWMKRLSDNGGNFIRIWLGTPFFDVEHSKSGVYDEEKAKRIDNLLAIARKHGIRVKMCIESFRHFGTTDQKWAEKSLHLLENGGTAKDIADFFDGERSRDQFRVKLAWYAKRFGDRPEIFGWELWNEINAVAGGDYMAWTAVMLPELRRLFPRNLVMQSLGSYDSPDAHDLYRRYATLPGNDVAQVHRYLDLGARLDACKGPVDLLAADAVHLMLNARPNRPVLLAESGAVEPQHSGPFKLYGKDRAGVLLHDVLFTPFFTGAAGPGHIWHWDSYVAKNDLWDQFGRFAEAVRGIDPPAERFEPVEIDHPRLRVYLLKGRSVSLLWCRDRENTWRTELEESRPPGIVEDAVLELGSRVGSWKSVRAYDPWANRWTNLKPKEMRVPLPRFTRSIVLRIDHS